MAQVRWALWGVYGFLWLGGVLSRGVSPQAPWAAPLFLAVAGALTIFENRAQWRPLACAAAAGFACELVGVHTGLPFGRYEYTAALAPSVFGVPLAIAFAWLILIDFVRSVCPSAALGAPLMAAIDLLIDPLASGPLHYWRWLDRGPYYGIPWINFAGWVLASAAILAALPPGPRRRPYAGGSVILFFAVLGVEYRLV